MTTYAEMKAALERAVEERGADFVYPEEWRETRMCRYRLPDGRPGCIVGLAMSYLMPDVVLQEFPRTPSSSPKDPSTSGTGRPGTPFSIRPRSPTPEDSLGVFIRTATCGPTARN